MGKNTIFVEIDKKDYKDLIGIDSSNKYYDKIAFINDGSGIITHGKLYETITNNAIIAVLADINKRLESIETSNDANEYALSDLNIRLEDVENIQNGNNKSY